MQPEALPHRVSATQAFIPTECGFGRSVISPSVNECVRYPIDLDDVAEFEAWRPCHAWFFPTSIKVTAHSFLRLRLGIRC